MTGRTFMDGQADKVDPINMHRVVGRQSHAKITGTHVGERVDIWELLEETDRWISWRRWPHDMAFPWCGEFPARVRQGLDNGHQQRAKSWDGGGFLHQPLLTGGDGNGSTWLGRTCAIDGSFVTQLGHVPDREGVELPLHRHTIEGAWDNIRSRTTEGSYDTTSRSNGY
jgi:hypothetical protein